MGAGSRRLVIGIGAALLGATLAVVSAARPARAAPAPRAADAASLAGPYASGSTGYDISWPQCGGAYPPGAYGFVVVGVNGGRANTRNPCLADEFGWAHGADPGPVAVYINLNTGTLRGTCDASDTACQSYNYGGAAAQDAVAYARQQGIFAAIWWLDIETGNTWSSDTALNAMVIQGATDFLQRQGYAVGIYSTPYQWGVIAGSYAPGLPNWTAGAPAADPESYCDRSFGGGKVWLTQWVATASDGVEYDNDYACADTNPTAAPPPMPSTPPPSGPPPSPAASRRS